MDVLCFLGSMALTSTPLMQAGINSHICNIPAETNLNKIAARLRKCPRGGEFGDQGWIVGTGIDIKTMNETLTAQNYQAPIDVLDNAFPDTPVLILDYTGHGALVTLLRLKDQTCLFTTTWIPLVE